VDANGNVVARDQDSFSDDQANRLVSATVGGTTATYSYDGDGKRATKTVGTSAPITYTYDINQSLPMLLSDGTRNYVYGLGLAFSVDTSGNLAVYHTDGLGSVRALTDPNGNIVQTYQADEFGVPALTQGSSAQPFGYAGQQTDAESAFQYLRARMYDPSTGRFLTADPTFGTLPSPLSLNPFLYTLDNPVTLVDPSGFSSSRALHNGAADNQCFSTAGGALWGNVVNALCLEMPLGGEVVVATVDVPFPHLVATLVFAKPPRGGGGGDVLDRLNRESPGRYTTNEEGARKALGLSRIQFRTAMHAVKQAAFTATNPNVIVDTQTGDVLAPSSGDVIGNLYDELRWQGGGQ
jgi:RHS repeat-associated protein